MKKTLFQITCGAIIWIALVIVVFAQPKELTYIFSRPYLQGDIVAYAMPINVRCTYFVDESKLVESEWFLNTADSLVLVGTGILDFTSSENGKWYLWYKNINIINEPVEKVQLGKIKLREKKL